VAQAAPHVRSTLEAPRGRGVTRRLTTHSSRSTRTYSTHACITRRSLHGVYIKVIPLRLYPTRPRCDKSDTVWLLLCRARMPSPP